MKIKSALFYENGKPLLIHINDLDKETYLAHYRGRLKCVNGCDARISASFGKGDKRFF